MLYKYKTLEGDIDNCERKNKPRRDSAVTVCAVKKSGEKSKKANQQTEIQLINLLIHYQSKTIDSSTNFNLQ